jgi:DNA-binding CsgD family transcriptional regulator
MSPEIARSTIALFRQLRQSHGSKDDVTPHETRLLQLLAAGHSYRTAAEQLRVSVSTISFHMRNIYRKLEVHSKSAASRKPFGAASSDQTLPASLGSSPSRFCCATLTRLPVQAGRDRAAGRIVSACDRPRQRATRRRRRRVIAINAGKEVSAL